MQIYRETERLKKVRALIDSGFPRLGVNKKQEIIRLAYEISKRESISPESLFYNITSKNFDTLKKLLIKRRYPHAFIHSKLDRVYLPKIELDPENIFFVKRKKYHPKYIFIEKSASNSFLVHRFQKYFPDANCLEIKSLKDYLKTKGNFTIKDYNSRRDTAFIVQENYDFFKKCPCTKKAIGCGYNIFNLSFGCIFDCTFCYLQEYVNTPGIIFPVNLNSFFDAFRSYKRHGMRIGTGEFSDSLMLDHITEYSLLLIDFFKRYPEVRFEFKTKSTNVENLMKVDHGGNIVVSWSINPQGIINDNEMLTPSLKERINAARRCKEADYRLAFHFDPVIYFKDWQKQYKDTVEYLFSYINPGDIAWISIGTLRFNPGIKRIIEERFPENKILNAELILEFDNKLRYPRKVRYAVYDFMLKVISRHSTDIPIYLCMEDTSMWRSLNKLRPITSVWRDLNGPYNARVV